MGIHSLSPYQSSYPPLDISFVHITFGLVRFPKFLNIFLRPVKISKKYRKNPVTTEKPVSKYDNTSLCKALVSCLGQKFWISKESKIPTLVCLNSSVGNVLFFVFWWHHMVVGPTLWRVTMLFLSDSSGNNHVKHNNTIYITRDIFPTLLAISIYVKYLFL